MTRGKRDWYIPTTIAMAIAILVLLTITLTSMAVSPPPNVMVIEECSVPAREYPCSAGNIVWLSPDSWVRVK